MYIVQRLEAQARCRRDVLNARAAAAAVPALNLLALAPPNGGAERRFTFSPLTNEQQRNRWARELAGELVDRVLFRLGGAPSWWVLVFDRCEKAPAEAQELVRQLVARAAGTDPATAEAADRGPLRVVLLGDSDALLPNPLYQDHIADEDLSGPDFDRNEGIEYFKIFCLSRRIRLALDDAGHQQRLETLADESLLRARELAQQPDPPPWRRALAQAVIEKTLILENQAAQKRGGG
jgi:hypothetical protein